MTAELQEKLRAGREAATRRRHAAEDENLVIFRAWLHDERRAWAHYQFTLDVYGPGDPVTDEAYSEWWLAYADAPQLPPDSAFKRARGDESEDS